METQLKLTDAKIDNLENRFISQLKMTDQKIDVLIDRLEIEKRLSRIESQQSAKVA